MSEACAEVSLAVVHPWCTDTRRDSSATERPQNDRGVNICPTQNETWWNSIYQPVHHNHLDTVTGSFPLKSIFPINPAAKASIAGGRML